GFFRSRLLGFSLFGDGVQFGLFRCLGGGVLGGGGPLLCGELLGLGLLLLHPTARIQLGAQYGQGVVVRIGLGQQGDLAVGLGVVAGVDGLLGRVGGKRKGFAQCVLGHLVVRLAIEHLQV